MSVEKGILFHELVVISGSLVPGSPVLGSTVYANPNSNWQSSLSDNVVAPQHNLSNGWKPQHFNTYYKCDPLSENPHSSHKCLCILKKTKFKNCLWNYASYWKMFTRASNQQRKLQINKNYVPSYSSSYGEFKNLCLVTVAWTVSVSRAFVYNAVDVNKIATAFLAKLPP